MADHDSPGRGSRAVGSQYRLRQIAHERGFGDLPRAMLTFQRHQRNDRGLGCTDAIDIAVADTGWKEGCHPDTRIPDIAGRLAVKVLLRTERPPAR
ncbi:hypothetical protein SAE02_10510 [Skermanella aerolata]|uniref:Uncharacterized protein n=1 Tax=Skermanella aerolata TaxID=393310 RepID=A0A512DK99_9PROT|nr:hypothetical protein SAE02_10510 [Skermanella aerolata]